MLDARCGWNIIESPPFAYVIYSRPLKSSIIVPSPLAMEYLPHGPMYRLPPFCSNTRLRSLAGDMATSCPNMELKFVIRDSASSVKNVALSLSGEDGFTAALTDAGLA